MPQKIWILQKTIKEGCFSTNIKHVHFCELNTRLVSLIFLLTATQRFSMGRTLANQQLLVSLAVWAEGSIKYSRMSWGLHWLDLRSEWTNTSRWHGSPHRHWLWKLHTGIQAPWTLGPWFPNEMQHLLSSEKLVLVHSDAGIHAEWGKEFRIKYKVHRNEHTSQRPDTDTENILFLIGLCHVLMFSDTSFYFFIMCKP